MTRAAGPLPPWLVVEAGAAELRIDHAWRAEVAEGPGTLAVAPDGAHVATVDPAGACHVWDRRTGAPVRRIDAATPLSSVAFHPDGQRLFLGAREGGQVRRADLATGRVEATWDVGAGLPGPAGVPDRVRELQVGPGGDLLAVEVGFTDFAAESWRTEAVLVAWDVPGARRAWHLREAEAAPWRAFRVTADGREVEVVHGPDVGRYDARTGDLRGRVPDAPARPDATSACGRYALALTPAPWRCGAIRAMVRAVADGTGLVVLGSRHAERRFLHVRFVPGADALLLATDDGIMLHGGLVARTLLEPALARPEPAPGEATGQEPTLGT